MDSILYNLPTPSFEVKPYEELEWIASSGTQYINTLVNSPSDGFRAVYDVKVIENLSSWNEHIGCEGDSGSGRNFIGNRNVDGGNYAWILGASSMYSSSTVPSVGTWYSVDASTVSGNRYIKVDGTTVLSNSNTASLSTLPIFIFALNHAGSPSLYCKIAIKGMKIYASSTLVRNYIPVRLTQSVTNSSGGTSVLGDVGLWDKVTGVFYENRGTGTFTPSSN